MDRICLPHEHHGIRPEMVPEVGEFQKIADTFKVLSDATRARLFWLLCHGEECVVNLAALMDMSSPALSHHLKLLKAMELISCRREGKEVYYKAAENRRAKALHEMMEWMEEISCPKEG